VGKDLAVMTNNIYEIFGSMVFNDDVMREKLPSDVYETLEQTIIEGRDLNITVANAVANAMKDWAIEKGATHYTHWFQPMTGITAEKHDSFLSIQKNGRILMEFSGKELIKGEPDASSFPSGGLRATFEARGYTAWDPTSYAFIKDNILCIPTAFYSFSGEVLDKKTPLLRSTELVSREATRILRLFGDDTTRVVTPNVGAEQEYFLVDKEMYKKRRDLFFTGRTLFGAMAPKGQEMGDHYFGTIKPRVAEFMRELNEELWKLGVYAKTQHNEAAPAQHELAPIFSSANIATDHNQLTMELMKKIADKHGLACLLHEKPFEGVNGSGKHNNWSLSTAGGENLFRPGSHPEKNTRFLLFLCAVIQAVHEHQDLLRITVATAGNDRRLGGHEAPPAIVSIFLGSELTDILSSIKNGTEYRAANVADMETGVHVLPNIPADTTDRNRTSPFAFTGNKFEFRMVGSSMSVAEPNIILNTIIADALSQFADRLEKAEDFETEVYALMRESLKKHDCVIFNGNNYTEAWKKEAERRGLLNLETTVDALPHFSKAENIALFSKYNIFSKTEIVSRSEIMYDNYCMTMRIEANTELEMIRRDILPSAEAYAELLSRSAMSKKALGLDFMCDSGFETLKKILENTNALSESADRLESLLRESDGLCSSIKRAEMIRDSIIPEMENARRFADNLEILVARSYWPFPTYGDLLFGV